MINWKSIEFLEDYNEELLTENLLLHLKIEKAIEYIKENCIDDEFYVNLTKKEKSIIKVLEILEDKENVNK